MESFEDLRRKQAAVASLAAQMANETDQAKIKSLTDRLQRESGELQKMALTFEPQEQSKHGQAADTDAAAGAEQRRIEAQTRSMAEQILKQIEGASPAAAQAVAKLRSDPDFCSGILLKE